MAHEQTPNLIVVKGLVCVGWSNVALYRAVRTRRHAAAYIRHAPGVMRSVHEKHSRGCSSLPVNSVLESEHSSTTTPRRQGGVEAGRPGRVAR